MNAVGCALLGALVVVAAARPSARWLLVDGAGVGFCGGLTTFSSFALSVVQEVRAGDATIAAANVVASVVLGVACAGAGAAVASRLLDTPSGAP